MNHSTPPGSTEGEKVKPCKRCNGTGIAVYGNTSTWRGGIGGDMMCEDVCDKCWGSGDINKPGQNLRINKSK